MTLTLFFLIYFELDKSLLSQKSIYFWRYQMFKLFMKH